MRLWLVRDDPAWRCSPKALRLSCVGSVLCTGVVCGLLYVVSGGNQVGDGMPKGVVVVLLVPAGLPKGRRMLRRCSVLCLTAEAEGVLSN
jgi:hypothetical protein